MFFKEKKEKILPIQDIEMGGAEFHVFHSPEYGVRLGLDYESFYSITWCTVC